MSTVAQRKGMMLRFALRPHAIRLGVQVIEVSLNGRFVATITANSDETGIRVLTRYLEKCEVDGEGMPAVVEIKFEV